MIEKPILLEPARPLADEKCGTNGNHHPGQGGRLGEGRPTIGRPMRRAIVGAIAVIAIIAILVFIASWIQKWLWMREVGYIGVFWTLFSVRWELFFAAFVIASLYFWINLRLAARNAVVLRAGSVTTGSDLTTRFGVQLSPKF